MTDDRQPEQLTPALDRPLKIERRIQYYHECGVILKVEVLDRQEKSYGPTAGEEYSLKLLEVIDRGSFAKAPKVGLEFTVWKALEDGGYAGWHLLDR